MGSLWLRWGCMVNGWLKTEVRNLFGHVELEMPVTGTGKIIYQGYGIFLVCGLALFNPDPI